jgi:hypothetical protein
MKEPVLEPTTGEAIEENPASLLHRSGARSGALRLELGGFDEGIGTLTVCPTVSTESEGRNRVPVGANLWTTGLLRCSSTELSAV